MAHTAYVFQFNLTNPRATQSSPAVSVGATIEAGQIDAEVVTVPMAKLHGQRLGVANGTDPLEVIEPIFDVVHIEQSNPIWMVVNTLNVSVRSNCDLRAGSTVTISGLTGSDTSDDTALAVFPRISGHFDVSGLWVQSAGNLTITSTGAMAHTAYVFQFNLTNPRATQSSPAVSVGATIEAGQIDAEVVTVPMAKLHGQRLGVANGTDPLEVIEPIFDVVHIEQSNPIWMVVNTLTVSLKSNCDLRAGSTVTISGLTGTATRDVGSLAVIDPAGGFDASGSWLQASGNLTLLSTGTSVDTVYVFTFDLRNPRGEQSSPAVSVGATIEAGPVDAEVVTQAMDKVNVERVGVANGSLPLKVIEPKMVVKEIEQSMPLWRVQNTLSVSLQANCDLRAGSVVTISGLNGSVTPSGNLSVVGWQVNQTANTTNGATNGGVMNFAESMAPFPARDGNGSARYWVESMADWSLDVGRLMLTTDRTTSAHALYGLAFNLTNGAHEQESPSVIVSATIEAGAVDADVVPTAVKKPNQELLGVANGTDPLKIIEPIFETFYMQQSSPLWQVINTISVSMKANCDLRAGSTITISGLSGSASVDSNLTVASSSADLDGVGLWLQAGNLTVTSTGTSQEVTYLLDFNLTNPAYAQPPPNVSVSATIETGVQTAPVIIRSVEVRSESLLSVPRGTEPLLMIEPNFTARAVGHSSSLALASNIISVSLQANCDLETASLITVSGITGSATVSTQSLRFWSEPAGLFMEPEADWNQTSGSLIIIVSSLPILANTSYVVEFEIRNGNIEQNAPSISVAATIEAGPLDAPVYFKTMTIPPVYDLLGVINGSNPMQIVEPRFIVKSIGQSNPLVAASNLISVTFQSNCDLAPMSNFTISGLSGSATADTMSMHTDTPYFATTPGGFLSAWSDWRMADGNLTLLVGSNSTSSYTTYIIEFEITNGVVVQDWQVVILSALVEGGTFDAPIYEKVMNVSNAAAVGVPNGNNPMLLFEPRLVIRNIGQSNPLASASNTLTITVQPNCDISPHSNISFYGLQGTQTPSTTRLSFTSNTSFFSESWSSWDMDSGNFTLVVGSTGIPVWQTSVIEFEVQNNRHEQPDVMVFARAQIEAGRSDSRVLPSVMDPSAEYRFGIENASLPLLTIVPVFNVSTIRQHYLWPRYLNQLTIHLQTNCNLTEFSQITISGLTRTLSPSGSVNVSEEVYSSYADAADWDQPSGTITLEIDQNGTDILRTYQLMIDLVNPEDNEGFPRNVTIKGFVESGIFDAPIYLIEMTQSQETLRGLEGAAAPLFVEQPEITLAEGAQQSPFPGVPNAIFVDFAFSMALPGGSQITIVGLTGMHAEDGDLPCLVRPLGYFLEVCTWNQNESAVVLHVAGEDTTEAPNHVRYSANFTLANPHAAYDTSGMIVDGDVIERGQSGYILPLALKVASTVLLEIPQFEDTFSTTTFDECLAMAGGCDLGQTLHFCAYDQDRATEITRCMTSCNDTVAAYGDVSEASVACCGLQCMDGCWARSLSVGPEEELGIRGQDLRVKCNDGFLSPYRVTLLRHEPHRMGPDLHTEIDRVGGFLVTAKAVLSPPCMYLDAPWMCDSMYMNGTLPGPRLNGTTEVPFNLQTGTAVFTDLVIDSYQGGEFQVLFYIVDYLTTGSFFGMNLHASPEPIAADNWWQSVASNVFNFSGWRNFTDTCVYTTSSSTTPATTSSTTPPTTTPRPVECTGVVAAMSVFGYESESVFQSEANVFLGALSVAIGGGVAPADISLGDDCVQSASGGRRLLASNENTTTEVQFTTTAAAFGTTTAAAFGTTTAAAFGTGVVGTSSALYGTTPFSLRIDFHVSVNSSSIQDTIRVMDTPDFLDTVRTAIFNLTGRDVETDWQLTARPAIYQNTSTTTTPPQTTSSTTTAPEETTTSTPAPTSSTTTTTPAPTSSTTTTTPAPTSSTTTTTPAPTTSSTTTTTPAPTTSSTTTTPVPTSSSTTTTPAPTSSSTTTTPVVTTTTPAPNTTTTLIETTSAFTSSTSAGLTSSTTTPPPTSTTTPPPTSTTTSTPLPTSTTSSTTTPPPTSTTTSTPPPTSTTTPAPNTTTTPMETTAAFTSSTTTPPPTATTTPPYRMTTTHFMTTNSTAPGSNSTSGQSLREESRKHGDTFVETSAWWFS